MEDKKDYLGNILSVGDTVVFMQIGYRGLLTGEIISISNSKAKMKHEPTNTGKTQTMQFHDQIIKIMKED